MTESRERVEADLDECDVFRGVDAFAGARPSEAVMPPAPLPQADPPAEPVDDRIREDLDRALETQFSFEPDAPPPAEHFEPAPKPTAAAEPNADIPVALGEIVERALSASIAHFHLDSCGGDLLATARSGGARGVLGRIDTAAFQSEMRRAAGIGPSAPLPASLVLKVPSSSSQAILEIDVLPWSGGIRFVARIRTRRCFEGLDSLGLEPHVAREISGALQRPHGGLILIAAPVSEGGRTTMLAAAADAAARGCWVVSMVGPQPDRPEWPWLSMPAPAGSVARDDVYEQALRHDPDCFVYGRIRRKEDAARVLRAVADGRTVIAAVAARGAVDAVSAMRHFDVDAAELASAKPLLVGQRLVRALCPSCRMPISHEDLGCSLDAFSSSEIETGSFYRAVGCDRCVDGFNGCLVLSEVLSPLDAVVVAVREGLTGSALNGRVPGLRLADSAFRAVARGRTTVEQVPLPMV